MTTATPPRPFRTAALAAGLAVLTACSGGGTATGPTPSGTPSVALTPAPSAVALPDHAAGRAAAWVLDLLDPGRDLDLDGAEDRFTAEFLAQVGVDELAQVLASVRPAGPWTVQDVQGDAAAVVVRIAGSGQDLDVHVSVDAGERIAGLWLGPAAPPRDAATSWEGLVDEVAGLPGQIAIQVAEVVDGSCRPVVEGGSAAGDQLPIGSLVKLYVLGAVVEAVARGDLAWDDELTLTDDVRSLPSGELQDAPAGTTVTVLEAAQGMIAISDNTATDLLVHAVGRERVEEAFAAMGHADPDVNVPFATTRELFQLGWGGGEELRTRWRDADDAERRAILAGLPGGPVEVDLATMGQTPVWPYGVDWFATAADLCAAHVALADLAGTPAGEPVRGILSANPGIEADAATWPYVAFKGGSSVGTMAGAWYAEGAAGSAGDVGARDDDGERAADGERAVRVVVVQSAVVLPQQTLLPAVMAGIVEDALRLPLP